MPNSISDPRQAIRDLALAEGFDVVRFTRAEAPTGAASNLQTFLGQGRHGTMDWMERNAGRRADPKTLWPEARSIIVLGANYGPDHDPLEALERPETGAISVYAQGKDYHDVLKSKLKRVAGAIARDFAADVKVFIDTAPVLEKPLAQTAGVGWQGKHTNLVSREFGSWLFLGSIFTKLSRETKFRARAELRHARLADLVQLDDAGFREFFQGSPIKRIGRDHFIRNVLIAIGNSGEARLAAAAEHLLADPSPFVRAMAVWALSRLLVEARFSALARAYALREQDEGVRAEWMMNSTALPSR